MRNATLRIGLAVALVLAGHRLAEAHHLTVREVLDKLNRDDVKQQTGIEEIAVPATLNRMLVIKVGPRWYKLPELERKRWAQVWLKMWNNAFLAGIVAVVDSVTGKPVVNFHPSGKVSLIDSYDAKLLK